MKITIHRGTHQIGGCVTEYEHNGWRLFVDYGEELPGGPKTGDLQVEGLTHGDISRSALLITHYHGDHIGCITKLSENLPVYMGKVSRDIQMELSNHMKSVNDVYQKMRDRLQTVNTFDPGIPFEWGEFKIMPVTVDHSAFDAYAFKIEADDVSVFHTGDFRTHGFRSGVLPAVIKKFIGKVDYVVCEATNVSRPSATSVSEQELQGEYRQLFKENKGSVVYVSSTNIDRLFGLYHAAIKERRLFIIDQYQKEMMDIVSQRDPIWRKAGLYKFEEEHSPFVLTYERGQLWMNDKLKKLLNDRGYVLIARANPRFDKFIAEIPGEKQKYLSMWEGYVKESCAAYKNDVAKSIGENYIYKHTSGHCDREGLREFFCLLQPKAILPIHTDKPEAFAQLFCDEWPVVLLQDGDSISPISPKLADTCSARIFCVKELNENTVVVEADENVKCWGLDEKFLGKFKSLESAQSVISHVVYRPDALLGYEIEEEEDMEPWITKVFDSKLELLATYSFGGHRPRGKNYQQDCRLKKGEKVLAVFQEFDAVIPAAVVGPVTPDVWRKIYEEKAIENSFEEFLDMLTDWDWDVVAVHPYVRFEHSRDILHDIELVSRVYLFPYRDFKEEAE